jgi:hypothetical protein
MSSVIKFFKKTAKSEEGFVFLIALVGVFVLMAIGFFALSSISEDLMVSYRLVGERKAYSAAESGVHAILGQDDFANATAVTQIDPVNDPTVTYSATVPVTSTVAPKVHLPGFPSGYSSNAYVTTVTGSDSTYGSNVTFEVGLADIPVPGDLTNETN